MGFRSLAGLQQAFQQNQFRSLADLQESFQKRQSAYSLLIAEHAETFIGDQGTSSNIGNLKKVFPSKGYGFIAPANGSQDVFVHFRDIVNGDSTDLVAGTEMSFELVIDEDGKRKAKNVTLMKLEEPETSIATESLNCQSYSRQMLLSAFRALHKTDALLQQNPCTPSAMYMPRQKSQHKRWYQEDPNLNDEEFLSKLEARLSAESGADANNVETFGDGVNGVWTFEKALEANSKLGRCRFGSGDSTPTATGESTSEHEYASQDFGDL